MQTYHFIIAILFALAISACKKDNPEPNLIPKQITLTAKGSQVIANSNEFGIELFTKTAVEENQNLMLSPLSASTALTMLLNGCGGDTYSQLKATLKYPEDMTIEQVNEVFQSLVSQLLKADPKVTLALANAIFYRSSFAVKPTFLATVSSEYEALVKGLDFSSPAALTEINKWASDNTLGKIPEVLDEISANTVMFIMNALYFKGNWSYKFDKKNTTSRPFILENGSSVDVSTMHGEVGAKAYYGDGFAAIELPYGQTNFTMVIVSPSQSLRQLLSTFNYDDWSSITQALDDQTDYSTLEVYMPKFNFSYDKVLNDQLMSMGMVDAFSELADLSGISDSRLFVSQVKQDTFIEVNEEGTEAAAVTVIDIRETTLPEAFNVNKPFIFAIRERTTNTLMFIGQVMDPR